MATLHSQGADQPLLIYIKGSFEALIERCATALDGSGAIVPISAGHLHREVDRLAESGLRVLAFARCEVPPGITQITHDTVAAGLTFLGLQASIDPPRDEAIIAVQKCQQAGVQVKMITGDHALTAAAIGKQIGLMGNYDQNVVGLPVLTGREIAQLSDEELIEQVERYAVFARVSPEQKLRLVDALQARGNVVAMTGDGVNDGPALKQSDIGIAMGITGTDVAKEAADMVLTDDNFATIEAAVEEGRGVFDNLTKIIAWTLPTNVGQGLILLVATLFGIVIPILPIQILWINMVSVSILGIVLAMEPREAGIMARPPRSPNAAILTPELIWRVVLVGVLILIGAFGLFEVMLSQGYSLEAARTVAVNVVIVIEIFYLLNCRSLYQSVFRVGLFTNRFVILGIAVMLLLQLGFTYLPVMNSWLGSAPIPWEAWGAIFGVGIVSFVIVELEKWFRRRRR
jgi:Ca2+-transporting ATPase